MKLAVFGDPVAHSLSPDIHQQFALHANLQVDYQTIHASVEEFAGALMAFRSSGGIGANLTVPHKHAGLSVCESLSARAEAAGAVNTLIRTDTSWHGDNTDGIGLIWDLQRLQLTISNSNILIIGAGGAAHGIIPVLLGHSPASITITNRTNNKAQQLAAHFKHQAVRACMLSNIGGLKNIDLIIHASAAGHSNDAFVLPSPATDLNPYCYDLSYGQASAAFLNWAADHQYPSSDGLGMLVGQAAEAFYLWTGFLLNNQVREDTLSYLLAA